MRAKRMMAAVLAAGMVLSSLTGCGSSAKTETSGNADTANADGTVDLEMWGVNEGYLPVEKGGDVYNFYKELTGVGITQPYVEWNGGSNYQQQLNLKISAGEMPDIFLPVNGMEGDLIKNGALLDLTDLLPEKAPHLWNSVPERVWDIIRSYDPTGEGRIYGIPDVRPFTPYTGMIRQDWLDELGLSMPTTQEEFVEVLRAFKTQDPNGNGAADELPTGGRQDAKWMDHLFAMYGVALQEGAPDWDIYDGELTYSAVTPNMKDARGFIHELAEEELVDPETLLNDKAAWDGKINSNRVGVTFRFAQDALLYAESMEAATGVKPNWVSMPAISAPGYESFYTTKQVNGLAWVAKNTDSQEKIDAVMKVFDAYGNPEYWDDFYYGIEGMHCETVDGKKKQKPDDKTTQQKLVIMPANSLADLDFKIQLYEDMKTEDRAWAIDEAIKAMKDVQPYGKVIAGDGMPSSVYNGYADILNRTLYVEYASKIITGEYDIDKFDEFVEKWYASGGEEVTKAAREWYQKTLQ